MTIADYQYIDATLVDRLVRELAGDVRAGARFIRDFVAGWEVRVARLLDAAERQDPEDVTTVLLSVRTSSAMLGAQSLSLAAADLQDDLVATRRVNKIAVVRFIELGTSACSELADLARRLESGGVPA